MAYNKQTITEQDDFNVTGNFSLSGTQVTSTASELNVQDGRIAQFTFSAASAASNVCEVTITPQDAASSTVADTRPFLVWLSDDSSGVGLTSTTATGTVTAKTSEGDVFGALTSKKAIVVQPKAAGTFVLEITDTNKTTFYVSACTLDGTTAYNVSSQLASGDYGA